MGDGADVLFRDVTRGRAFAAASPGHALVLSVYEMNHTQALDGTQPVLPVKRRRGATMTDDHKRHGMITLLAALDIKVIMAIGQRMLRHRAAGGVDHAH